MIGRTALLAKFKSTAGGLIFGLEVTGIPLAELGRKPTREKLLPLSGLDNGSKKIYVPIFL